MSLIGSTEYFNVNNSGWIEYMEIMEQSLKVNVEGSDKSTNVDNVNRTRSIWYSQELCVT